MAILPLMMMAAEPPVVKGITEAERAIGLQMYALKLEAIIKAHEAQKQAMEMDQRIAQYSASLALKCESGQLSNDFKCAEKAKDVPK